MYVLLTKSYKKLILEARHLINDGGFCYLMPEMHLIDVWKIRTLSEMF